MTIRAKAILIIGLSAVCLLILPYLALQRILQASTMKLEEQVAKQHAASASSIIDDELERMEGTADDWAAWTETYEFLIGNDPGYPDENLIPSTFSHLKLNVFLFVDTLGHPFYGQGYDLKAGKAALVPDSLKSLALEDKLLLKRMLAPAGIKGLLLVDGKPMFIAIRPVTRSDYSGPPAGALITAKYLDNVQTSRLSTKLGQIMSVYSSDDPRAPAFSSALALDTDRPLVLDNIVRQGNNISGFAVIPDLARKQNLTVQVTIQRTVYKESLSNIYSFIFALLPTVFIFSLLTYLLLEHLILSRLTRLTWRVGRIGESGDFSERIKMRGRDEVAVLSSEINKMLTALAQSNEAMRENDLARRQFFEGASHELKTPLTALLGMVETLLRGTADANMQKKFLERIREQTLRMAQLVNDLLALSGLDSAQKVMIIEQVDICEMLCASVDNIRERAQAQGTALHTQCPVEVVIAAVDRDALLLVIGNLLDNALKYTQSGGSIHTKCYQAEGFATFEVSDTGVGISPADQSRVFDRFYRADKARSREMGGTGLGLSVVSELVALMGGKVQVTSKLGEGSTFTVLLPQPGGDGAPEM